MRRAALLLALGATGCAPPAAERRREALAEEPRITPGIYSDVRLNPEAGDLGGMELYLDQGSTSTEVQFVHCYGWCNQVQRVAVRRGLNGVYFDASDFLGSQTTTFTVQPDGPSAVTITVDWGSGVQSRRLPLADREFGLDVARNNPNSADAAATPRP